MANIYQITQNTLIQLWKLSFAIIYSMADIYSVWVHMTSYNSNYKRGRWHLTLTWFSLSASAAADDSINYWTKKYLLTLSQGCNIIMVGSLCYYLSTKSVWVMYCAYNAIFITMLLSLRPDSVVRRQARWGPPLTGMVYTYTHIYTFTQTNRSMYG